MLEVSIPEDEDDMADLLRNQGYKIASKQNAHLKKALSLDPEFGLANFNLGNSLFALNRLDEAHKRFELSQKQGVDFLSMHWKLYEIHKKNQRHRDAEKELKIILEIDPFNEQAKKKLSELPILH